MNPIQLKDGDELEVVLAQLSIHKNHMMGRFRLSVTSDKQPTIPQIDAELLAALETAKNKRDTKQQQLIRSAFMTNDEAFANLQRRVKLENKKLQRLDKLIPNVIVMGNQAKMRKSFRLDRGSYEAPAEEVSARVTVDVCHTKERRAIGTAWTWRTGSSTMPIL